MSRRCGGLEVLQDGVPQSHLGPASELLVDRTPAAEFSRQLPPWPPRPGNQEYGVKNPAMIGRRSAAPFDLDIATEESPFLVGHRFGRPGLFKPGSLPVVFRPARGGAFYPGAQGNRIKKIGPMGSRSLYLRLFAGGVSITHRCKSKPLIGRRRRYHQFVTCGAGHKRPPQGRLRLRSTE